MFNKRTTLAVSAGLTVAVCSTALAGNPFKGLTTTEGGYHTWDSDLALTDIPGVNILIYRVSLDSPAVLTAKVKLHGIELVGSSIELLVAGVAAPDVQYEYDENGLHERTYLARICS